MVPEYCEKCELVWLEPLLVDIHFLKKKEKEKKEMILPTMHIKTDL